MKGRVVRGSLSLLLLLPLLLLVWTYPIGDSAVAQSAGDVRGKRPSPPLIADDDDDDDDGGGPGTPQGGPFWEIDGNDNIDLTLFDHFLGTVTGTNEDVVFKTNGLERMRIFKSAGPQDQFSDLDGLVEIKTNLSVNPTPMFNGDLFMPFGIWHGRADGFSSDPPAGDLRLDRGSLFLDAGGFAPANVELSDGDVIMPHGRWRGMMTSATISTLRCSTTYSER